MQIYIDDRSLRKYIWNDELLRKHYGDRMAAKIKLRLEQLISIRTLNDLKHLSGNFHELTGRRKRQWSCDLIQPYRLIFVPVSLNAIDLKQKINLFDELEGVRILEITDYH